MLKVCFLSLKVLIGRARTGKGLGRNGGCEVSLIYIVKSGIVICQDAGCEGCEHSEPHEYDSCDTGCDGGGDHNCPACEPITKGE